MYYCCNIAKSFFSSKFICIQKDACFSESSRIVTNPSSTCTSVMHASFTNSPPSVWNRPFTTLPNKLCAWSLLFIVQVSARHTLHTAAHLSICCFLVRLCLRLYQKKRRTPTVSEPEGVLWAFRHQTNTCPSKCWFVLPPFKQQSLRCKWGAFYTDLLSHHVIFVYKENQNWRGWGCGCPKNGDPFFHKKKRLETDVAISYVRKL